MIRRKNQNDGITLIALVITIIVLLILAGISIAMLTGENGILTKADTAQRETDIQETKEQIKLEIMGNADENGDYTNLDVVQAVKKITNKDIEEMEEIVLSKKGNRVDISELWKKEKQITFFIRDYYDESKKATFSVPENTTWLQFLTNYTNYDWSELQGDIGRSVEVFIQVFLDYYEDLTSGWYVEMNNSLISFKIWSEEEMEDVSVGLNEPILRWKMLFN